MTQGVDRAAVLNYLTDSMRVLHAEDQRLKQVMARVRSTRTIGPDEFEALCDAQSTSLRIPANALLMHDGLPVVGVLAERRPFDRHARRAHGLDLGQRFDGFDSCRHGLSDHRRAPCAERAFALCYISRADRTSEDG